MINCDVAVLLQEFLNSAANCGKWLDSRPGRFIPDGRAASRHHISGWVNPSTVLDVAEKKDKILFLSGIETPYPDQSAYSSECTD
jgi:hypothetical protein